MPRKSILNHRILTAAILAVISGTAFADTEYVTNADNDGPGSFRAAVEAANSDSAIDTIEFADSWDITLDSEVHYTGAQDLTILGDGASLIGDCPLSYSWDGGLFASYSAADITIHSLAFVDSCNNGVGVFLPGDAKGQVAVTLWDVIITGSRFHGLFVDGQDSSGSYNTDDIAHPDCADPHPVDSQAGIELDIEGSEFTFNGNLDGLADDAWPFEVHQDSVCEDDVPTALTGCPADFDGVRIDDGGHGSITAWMADSLANDNLADGVEYDERGNGNVTSWAHYLTVMGNGDTSAFEIDNPCDEGETISDLDDGFDIDEDDNGNLWAGFEEVIASANNDEGLDLDEAGNGSATLLVQGAEANANEDEGIKVDESGNGNLFATIDAAEVNDSDSQDGMEFTEEDNGNLMVDISNTDANGNDGAAIAGEQQPKGKGRIRVTDSDLTGNADPSIDVDEDEIEVQLNNTATD